MERAADAGADYATRLLLNYSIAASRVDDILRGLSDAEIRAEEPALHEAMKALVAQLPQASAAFVVDREGVPLVAADRMPVPRVATARDRDFFHALSGEDAPEVHISRVYASRFDGRPFFAVSRRRSNTGNALEAGGFDGLVNLSVEPALVAAGLSRLLARPGDAIALIRADGAILTRTTGAYGPLSFLPVSSPFHGFAKAGAKTATYRVTAPINGQPQLVALRRLDRLPVYAAVIRSRSAIAGSSVEAAGPQFAIGIPATLALLALALLVRRSQLDLITANGGL